MERMIRKEVYSIKEFSDAGAAFPEGREETCEVGPGGNSQRWNSKASLQLGTITYGN